MTCLNLTTYRIYNHLNTNTAVFQDRKVGKLEIWNKNLVWATYYLMKIVLNILLKKACLEVADGWKRQLVFPGAEVVAATCIAGGQWACSWWLLWVHQFGTVITAAGDPFLYPALCKQQLITTKHQASLVQHQIREPESCLLKAAFYLLADMSIFTEWGSTFAQLEHDSFATLALSGPIFQH